MINRKYVEISQNEYYDAKRKGPISLIEKDFMKDHEIYHPLISCVRGKYYLSYSYEKKIYKGA